MARIITDAVYAKLVARLAEDEAVALFQQLLLSKKTDEQADEKITEQEGRNDLRTSNAEG